MLASGWEEGQTAREEGRKEGGEGRGEGDETERGEMRGQTSEVNAVSNF